MALKSEQNKSLQLADPHHAMILFQAALREGFLELHPVRQYRDLFSHLDQPSPGVVRFTYARLAEDRVTVKAFASFIMNGQIDGYPCIAVGYAVPIEFRNKGYAKAIFMDVIDEMSVQAGRNGAKVIFIEAVVDIENTPSQKVAESVLAGIEWSSRVQFCN